MGARDIPAVSDYVCLILFNDDDEVHILATVLFRELRSTRHEPDDVICGMVYHANETVGKIIDFTMDDYMYIRDRILNCNSV